MPAALVESVEHVSGPNALQVFAPPRDADCERLRGGGGLEDAATQGRRHAEVLEEIGALQRGTVSWITGALTVLVSLVLFLGAGAAVWTVTIGLVPVLLFHELGHYVAMRVFQHRDPRMFVIPFFGAAVTARQSNVAGWKRAIVSMMGPMPGIVAGGLIGLAGPPLGLAWAREAALLLLVINGLNLLPLLPLDGGWVVHTLLSARHHVLAGAFQLLAAVPLAFAGITFNDPLLGLLAVVLLGGASHSYRLACIARELRAGGLSATAPDDQTIPPAMADSIIDHVKAAFPKSNARVLAQRTLQVFDIINARPPRWPVAVALGAVYVGGIGAALVLAAVVTVGPTHIAASVDHLLAPPWSLDTGGVRGDELAGFPGAGPGSTIVATFASPSEARDAFVAADARRASGASAALFGQSLVLHGGGPLLPAWSAAAAQGARDVLVATAATRVDFTLTCTAPTAAAAAALAATTGEFFLLPADLRLIPPWASPDPRTPEVRARHFRARQALIRPASAGDGAANDAAWRNPVQSISAIEPADEAGRRVDAPTLGALAASGPAARQFATAGNAWARGRTVRVDSVRFEDLFHGPAALAAWLRANGCARPHYRFQAPDRSQPPASPS